MGISTQSIPVQRSSTAPIEPPTGCPEGIPTGTHVNQGLTEWTQKLLPQQHPNEVWSSLNSGQQQGLFHTIVQICHQIVFSQNQG